MAQTVGQAGALGQWVLLQDGERLSRYRDLLAFYEGSQWQGRARPGERRLVLNYARIFVRKAVSYLFSEPVKQAVPLDEVAADGRPRSPAAELALQKVYEANDLERVDFDVALDAAVLGDGAFKVTWDPLTRQPRVTAVDVQGLYAWWRGDDVRQVIRVAQTYTLGAAAVRAQFGLTAGGQTARVVEDWTATSLTIEVDGQVVRSGRNPYPWIPYVIFPNESRPHEFWGVSDLEDLLAVNRALNERVSTLATILDLSGAPIAVLENVDGSDGIAVKPGAKWELPEGARAYLLDLLSGGGVALHMQAIEQLYRAIHDIGETPRTAFGDGSRVLSGVALEVELQPLIQKVKRKRAIWNGVYRQRNRMIFDLLRQHGQGVGVKRTVAVWGPITPRDRSVLVKDEVALVGAGIHSRQRASERLGDDNAPAEFAAWLEEQRRIGAMSNEQRAMSDGGGHDGRG